MSKNHYIGWELDAVSRAALLARFPQKYSKLIAHHVTFKFGVNDESLMPILHSSKVVGYVDDGVGIEGLIVEINGTTARPDGSTYHITWSLNPTTHRPVHTNHAIKTHGWNKLSQPINILIKPKVF